MEYTIYIVIGVVIIAITLATIISFSRGKSKTESVKAEILSKSMGSSANYSPKRRGAAVSGVCPIEYYVTFLNENGKKIELQVNAETYNRLTEKEKGTLTFDRYYFISFEK